MEDSYKHLLNPAQGLRDHCFLLTPLPVMHSKFSLTFGKATSNRYCPNMYYFPNQGRMLRANFTNTFALIRSVLHAYLDIIPTLHHYAYFAQFDWLEKTFYTLINSISMNLGTIFLSLDPKMYNNVDKNMILMTKLEL